MVKTHASSRTTCCRLCRRSDLGRSWDIFQDDLAWKITSLANVQIQENDRLPKIICTKCRDLVEDFYKFKNQVEKTDYDLRQALLKNSVDISPVVLIENLDMVEATVAYLKKNNFNFCRVNRDKNKENNQTESNINQCNPKIEASGENKVQSNSLLKEKSTANGDLSSNGNSDQVDGKSVMLRTNRHKCSYCIKSFPNRSLLEKHVVIHQKQPETIYVCYLCDEKFSSAEKVKNHAEKIHNTKTRKERESKNDDTSEESFDESDSEDSTYNPKTKKKYSCKFCGRSFTYYKSFLAHLEHHPDDYNKFFKEISKRPKIIETAARVLNFTTPTNFNSNSIGAKPNSNLKNASDQAENGEVKNDNQNQDSNQGNRNFVCNECGKVVSSRGVLKKHLLTHANGTSSTDVCSENEPPNRSNSENILKKITKHLRPHKCTLCKKAFAQHQSLINHLEKHKQTSEHPKRYLCEICSKIFNLSASLKVHMRTHTGVKPYACNVCNRAFSKKSYLRLHLRIHSGEKPYTCEYCNKNFARANTLSRHLTVHTNEAKYQCKVCSKKFRRLTSLNEHTFTHTGQRPYVCKICSKSYNNAGSLYAHRKKCQKKIILDIPVLTPEPLQPIENNLYSSQEVYSPSTQTLVFSDNRLDEMMFNDASAIESSYQYVITALPEQTPIEILHSFPVEESDIYDMNLKHFSTSEDEIFQSL